MKNQQPTVVIGFGHRKFVGKNLAASLLAKLHNGNNDNYSFALKLKQDAYDKFHYWGLREPSYYEQHSNLKETVVPGLGRSPRDLWILHGNMMRTLHPDVWVQCVLDSIGRSGLSLASISDVRYPNEVAAIKAAGGYVVRVDRDSAPVGSDVADNALADFHDWDHVIPNHGTVDELRIEIAKMAKHLGVVA